MCLIVQQCLSLCATRLLLSDFQSVFPQSLYGYSRFSYSLMRITKESIWCLLHDFLKYHFQVQLEYYIICTKWLCKGLLVLMTCTHRVKAGNTVHHMSHSWVSNWPKHACIWTDGLKPTQGVNLQALHSTFFCVKFALFLFFSKFFCLF